jgi:hypothetical protein
MTIGGLDSSVLLGFYQSQLSSNPSSISAATQRIAQQQASQHKGATANDNPPWNTPNTNNSKQDAQVLSTTNFLDTSKVPLSAGATTDSKMEQDNQKLFALYGAANTLAYLAKMAQKPDATSGQLAGLNDRFQKGLGQIEQYLSSTSFNNFKLQAAKPSDNVVAGATIAFSNFTYATKQLVSNAQLNNALPGLSASDSFTIGIKKGGTTTNVVIDLSQVSGTLNLTNIVSYINDQLSAAGFSTRFQKTQHGGTATSDKDATYGLQVTPGGVEQVSLSAASTPALYLVGNSGLATETQTTTNSVTSAVTTTPPDQKGRLTKLSGIDGSPTSTFGVTTNATNGTTTAQRTAVDSSGNVYVIGTATGDFGSQLNQGAQDVYLTKYDSAGNVVWQNLLGSGGSANGYDLALDPSGGVVVTGASTADLTTTSVADGNNDSFVARYDSSGAQTWIKQIQTLATNQANALSVDASGNVYIGGTVSGGAIGAGQVSSGGGDAYLAKFDSKGKLLAEQQFGSSSADSVGAMATASDGSLYVASVQNGHAILAKYAGGDITSAPVWSQDLGALSAGGAIGGLATQGGKIYVSGSTSNNNLTAGGAASIAAASSGGVDAFVFSATDNGATVSANTVTYIGTGASETAGAVTVAADGTVFLTGSTTGTFAGAQRTVQNVTNAFAASISATGSVNWTRQYGGADGVSTGAGLAIDPNGSSVLDALGLPRGTISLNQSVDLTQQTTLRAGDSFQIAIQGTAARTATITIDQGETYDSLVTKINAQLGGIGKASVNYTGGGENMRLQVNAGNTINLVAGPKDFDALARLGLTAGVLTSPAKGTPASVTSATSKSKVTPTYGLGLTGITGPLDISTKAGADMARSTLLTVLSNIQSTYQTTNAPPPGAQAPGNRHGSASVATTSQLANYNLALGLMGADPNNAVANIQAIVSNGGKSSDGGLSSLLGALGGLA